VGSFFSLFPKEQRFGIYEPAWSQGEGNNSFHTYFWPFSFVAGIQDSRESGWCMREIQTVLFLSVDVMTA
jgi:hypothetical protein